MSWDCTEQRESRQESEASNGSRTGKRVFIVAARSDETIDSAADVRAKFGTTATNGVELPGYRFQFSDDPSLLSAAVEIEPVDSGAHIWRVTWLYKTLYTGEKNPTEVGYMEWSESGGLEFRDKWRTGYTLPVAQYPDGSIPGNVSVEVFGSRIDAAGEPVSVLHSTGRMSIIEVVDEANFQSYRAAWLLASGKRNMTAFAGRPKGTLLFLPPTVTKVAPSRYRFQYEMAYDADQHLVQFAQRLADGGPSLEYDSQTGAVQAYPVVWRQPFPQVTDFYAVSPNFAFFA